MTSRAQKIIIGLAVAVLIVLVVLGIFVGAAVYGWKAAQRAGNETATLLNLKTIAAAEAQYFNTHQRTFGTFDEMIKEQSLSSKFAGNPVVADGYVLDLKIKSGPRSSYVLSADPRDDSSGKNHFYLDSISEKIHMNPEKPASAFDPIQ